MNPISGYRVPNILSSREQELEKHLNERLANRLSDIRQRITPPAEPAKYPGIGQILDVHA